LTLAGIGCLGFSVAFLFVPLLPEIIAAVAEKEGLDNSPFLSDKASGIYNSAYGIGNCLAPIIGGAITATRTHEQFYPDTKKFEPNNTEGFRLCCDVMAFASLGFCLIYALFAIIPAELQKRKNLVKESREKQLLAGLAPNGGAVDNSLTIEFENNRSQIGNGGLNNSNQVDSMRFSSTKDI